jgi:hypothetical protein
MQPQVMPRAANSVKTEYRGKSQFSRNGTMHSLLAGAILFPNVSSNGADASSFG